jgi:hypothetical protein
VNDFCIRLFGLVGVRESKFREVGMACHSGDRLQTLTISSFRRVNLLIVIVFGCLLQILACNKCKVPNPAVFNLQYFDAIGSQRQGASYDLRALNHFYASENTKFNEAEIKDILEKQRQRRVANDYQALAEKGVKYEVGKAIDLGVTYGLKSPSGRLLGGFVKDGAEGGLDWYFRRAAADRDRLLKRNFADDLNSIPHTDNVKASDVREFYTARNRDESFSVSLKRRLANHPRRRRNSHDSSPPQVCGELTSAAPASFFVAGLRPVIVRSMERDLPLTLISATIGIFFNMRRKLVCHSSLLGSGYSV